MIIMIMMMMMIMVMMMVLMVVMVVMVVVVMVMMMMTKGARVETDGQGENTSSYPFLLPAAWGGFFARGEE